MQVNFTRESTFKKVACIIACISLLIIVKEYHRRLLISNTFMTLNMLYLGMIFMILFANFVMLTLWIPIIMCNRCLTVHKKGMLRFQIN